MDSAEVTEIKRHIDGATEGFRASFTALESWMDDQFEETRAMIRLS